MSNYKPTGYPKGRPRKGEIRPKTPGGVNQALIREKKKREMGVEAYNAMRAEYQREWTAANPERSKEINHSKSIRRKAWRTLYAEIADLSSTEN